MIHITQSKHLGLTNYNKSLKQIHASIYCLVYALLTKIIDFVFEHVRLCAKQYPVKREHYKKQILAQISPSRSFTQYNTYTRNFI